MKRICPLVSGCLLWAQVVSSAAAGQLYYSKREFVSDSTGLLESYADGDWYRGSGVVARDSKLIYSCAHLFYEAGEWSTDYNFYRACDDYYYPEESTAVSPRGLHYFTSYSSAVDSYGSDSNRAFASDFTVLYGNSSFGKPVGWWSRGAPVLQSSRLKRIVGYPSEIDYTGASGRCYQHSTGWFGYGAYQIRGGYHEFDDVSTGSGNSGGPIFVQDDSGDDFLAGILVSGTRRTAGVVALDLSTHTMAGYALGLKDKTLTFSNTIGYKLPDGSVPYSKIPLRVSGFSGSVARLKLNLSVSTQRRGDLDVYLKSPGGRIRWISKRSGDSADNLNIIGANLTKTFFGSQPNGTWELRIRDAVKGTRATFVRASLTVSAL